MTKKRLALKRKEKKKEKKKPPTYEAVTVSHQRKEDAFRASRSATILDRKRLEEKRGRSVPESLQEEAGIFVQKTNHGAGAPIIRGSIGPQVLILMDGVRMNTATYRTGPSQYLNQVDPWALDRIEVLRGGASLAYGTQAFGGVIGLQSRKPLLEYGDTARFGAEAIGRYGSADQERTARASGSFGIKGFGLHAGVTYSDFGDLRAGGEIRSPDASNTRLFQQQTPFGLLVTDGATGGQMYSSYRALFVDSGLRWDIGEMWTISAAYQRAMLFDAGRAEQLIQSGDLRFYDNTRDMAYLRAEGRFQALRTKLTLTLSYQQQDEKILRYRFNTTDLTQRTRIEENRENTQSLGITLTGESRVGDWLILSYGLDHYSDIVDAEASRDGQSRPPTFSPNSQYHSLGAYLSGRARLWGWEPQSGFYLHLGGRIAGFLMDAPARSNLEAVQFQQLGHALYASLQLLYRRNLNISFSYSEGFRAPNLQEVSQIGDTGNAFEIPNPALRPEVSRSLELLIKGRYGQRVTGWVSGYYSFWQDLITREATTYNGQSTVEGKQVEWNINRERADIMGVETGLSVWIVAGLSAAASLTWTHGIAYLPNGGDEPVSRIPPLFSTISMRYNFGDIAYLEAFALLTAAQDRLSERDKRDTRIPEGGTPGWWTLNLRGAARINRHLRFVLFVENLLNAQYKYHGSGILAPGLSARIGLEGTL
jgi:outer membrane receptor protein involved in Fe transport